MPALEPPSMQIGTLPPGYAPIPVVGPPLTAGQAGALGQPVVVQQVSVATTTAAPASVTLTIAGSQPGSTILLAVAVAASAATAITQPTNFVTMGGSVGSNGGNTLSVGLYFLQPANNPGGITSLLTSVTNANGIGCWALELGGNWLPAPYPASNTAGNFNAGAFAGGSQSCNNSSAATTNAGITPLAGPMVIWGCEADVTGQAYTPANVGGTWVTGSSATSTTGATLIVIRPFYQIVNAVSPNVLYKIAGTLAGAIANGVAMATLPMALTGSLVEPMPLGELGSGIQIGGWGVLGGTKPGGAGGGQ